MTTSDTAAPPDYPNSYANDFFLGLTVVSGETVEDSADSPSNSYQKLDNYTDDVWTAALDYRVGYLPPPAGFDLTLSDPAPWWSQQWALTCGSPQATPSPTATATETVSPTATVSPTPTGPFTPTITVTDTPTITQTISPTATISPTLTATWTATPTATETASPTATVSPTVTTTATPTAVPAAIFVSNFGGESGGSVTAYAPGSDGDVTPASTISGDNTELDNPQGIARDSAGKIYLTNWTNNSITVYSGGSNGDVAPTTINSTSLNGPMGIALDASGNIYVANINNSITKFAAGSSGTVSPSAVISGGSTGLNVSGGIAVDSSANIYVANGDNNSITIYAAGSNGDTPPTATISGTYTELNQPYGIALDASGNIYVANCGSDCGGVRTANASITVYAAGSSGNAAPSATISGNHTRLGGPASIALDSSGNIYVANSNDDIITAYASGSNGNAAPFAIIEGATTGLDQPVGITAGPVIVAFPTPTVSSTVTATATSTISPTATLIVTPSVTPSPTDTQSTTDTETATPTGPTPTITATPTATATATQTLSPTSTITLTPTLTATPTITGSPTPTGPTPTATSAASGAWPMFNHDLAHTGLSQFDTSANTGTQEWKFTTGSGVYSSAVIGPNGDIYVGSSDTKLYAIKHSDHTQKWAFTTGGDVRSSPAISADGNTIYVGSDDGHLYAVSSSDGSQQWMYPTASATPIGAVGSSPAISSDGYSVYVGSDDGNLYAIWTGADGIHTAGTKDWAFTTGYFVESSPAISADGYIVYVGSDDDNLYAVWTGKDSTHTGGTQKWAFATGDEVNSSPTIGADGTIYVGSYDGNLYAVCNTTDSGSCSGGPGTQKWAFATGFFVESSPAIGPDGTIYVGSDDDNLYAVNPDGSQKWYFATNIFVESSPVVGADGTIYIGSDDNNLYAVYRDGSQKWIFPTGGFLISAPAIGSDGTIYAGSGDGSLYALGSGAGAPPTPTWTASPTETVTPTLTASATATPTATKTGTPSPTATPMPIQFVGVGALAGNAGGSDVACYLPTGSASGDVDIAYLSMNGAPSTVTPPAGWTEVTHVGPVGNEQFWAFYIVRGSSAPGTTFTMDSDTYVSCYIVEYSHENQSSPIDQINTTSASSVGSIDSAQVTPSQPGDQLIVAFGENDGLTVTGHSVSGTPALTNEWEQTDQNAYATQWGGDVALDNTSPTTAYTMTYNGSSYNAASIVVALNPVWASGPTPTGPTPTITPTATPVPPWPMFGHDLSHSGLSPFDTSSNNGALKWTYQTGGAIESQPAIGADGTVYVGSDDGHLYAFNSGGSVMWTYPGTGASAIGEVNSAPAISADGATIYFGSADSNLYAINTDDGTLEWKYAAGGPINFSSPAISPSDGTIYVGSDDHHLYAVNPDGSLKWKFTAGDMVETSPAVGPDGTIYFGSFDDRVYAVNTDGTQKWVFTTGAEIDFSSPSISADGNVIYIGSTDTNFYAINTSNGMNRWIFPAESEVESSGSAIGSDGKIYFGSDSNYLFSITDGGSSGAEEYWAAATGNFVYSAPVIGSDAAVYFGSEDGNFYAVNHDGSSKWTFLGGLEITGSPAIGADGTVYIGDETGIFYAFGAGGTIPTPTPTPTPVYVPGSTSVLMSPTALAFGATPEYGVATQNVTFAVTGSELFQVSGVTFSDPGDFAVVGNTCSAGASPSGTCTVTIGFIPKALGTIAGTVAISDNADSSPQIVNLAGTGTAPVNTAVSVVPGSVEFGSVAQESSATAIVTIKNDSAFIPLFVSGVTLSDGSDFGIIGNGCPAPTGISPGGSCSITLDFAPQPQTSYPATINGTLTLTDNVTGGATAVSLTGAVTSATTPLVSVSPNAVNFGSSTEGSPAPTQSITITNHSGGTMNISNMTLAGALGFAIASSTCGSPIADAASCVVGLSFTPQSISTSGTTINGTLMIADDIVGSPQQFVNLTGTGIPPETNAVASYAPTPVTFAAAMGYSTQQNLTVTNASGNPLYLSKLTLDDRKDFGIASNECPMAPNSLASSASCTIALNFAPQSNGTMSGNLNIYDNTTASQPEMVALSGTTLGCPIGLGSGPMPPVATPQIFFSGEDTQLTVTSVVPPSPDLIPTSVTLLRVDSNGNLQQNLGQMYNDGTHGDAVAGDAQYTGQFTFHELSAGNIYLAVQATYPGTPSCRQSHNNELPIIAAKTRPTMTELHAEENVVRGALKFLENDYAIVGKDQAKLDVVQYLLKQPLVAHADLADDGSSIEIIYTSGRGAAFEFVSPGIEGGSSSSNKVKARTPKPKPTPMTKVPGGGQ